MPPPPATESAKRPLIVPSESPEPSKVAKTLEGGGDAEVVVEEAQEEEKELEAESRSMRQNPRLQRYLIAVEYIGTRFFGSQKQPNCRTVAGALEEAFHKFVGQPISAVCSSRTVCLHGRTGGGMWYLDSGCSRHMTGDRSKFTLLEPRDGGYVTFGDNAKKKIIDIGNVGKSSSISIEKVLFDSGVHALSNVFHVDVERISKRKPDDVLPPHEPGVVRRAVNHFLQREGDISVTDVQCVPADFHARFKALERTYYYRLLSGPEPLPVFEKERAWHVPEELDILEMKKACNVLVGHHDFSSFRASGCQATSPVRTLDELSVCEVAPFLCFPSSTEKSDMSLKSSTADSSSSYVVPGKCIAESTSLFGKRSRHRCLVIAARSRSFLYHQVRLLVGVLKCAGTGELTPDDVERILNAKTVTAASPMAPACGLYLGNVKYFFS